MVKKMRAKTYHSMIKVKVNSPSRQIQQHSRVSITRWAHALNPYNVCKLHSAKKICSRSPMKKKTFLKKCKGGK